MFKIKNLYNEPPCNQRSNFINNFASMYPSPTWFLKGRFLTINRKTYLDKNAPSFLQVVVQKTLLRKSSMEEQKKWIKKNTYNSHKQDNSEHPVILPNKVQPVTLSWIPNLQQSWLRDSRQIPFMVALLSTSGVQTPGLTVALIGERRFLVTNGPLGEPRKAEIKGGG